MKEKAKEQDKWKIIFMALGVAMAIGGQVIRGRVELFPWLFDICSVVGMAMFLYVFVRFYTTHFYYELGELNLKIYKGNGKKRPELVADVPYKNIPRVSHKDSDDVFPTTIKVTEYNYCSSIFPAKPCCIYTRMDPSYGEIIKIECSPEFFDRLHVLQKRFYKGKI